MQGKQHKEIMELKKKLSQISGVQQILEMEETLKNAKDEKFQLERKIKDTEQRVKE